MLSMAYIMEWTISMEGLLFVTRIYGKNLPHKITTMIANYQDLSRIFQFYQVQRSLYKDKIPQILAHTLPLIQ